MSTCQVGSATRKVYFDHTERPQWPQTIHLGLNTTHRLVKKPNHWPLLVDKHTTTFFPQLRQMLTDLVLSPRKFGIKSSLKVTPHLKRDATLPCKIFGAFLTHRGQRPGFLRDHVHQSGIKLLTRLR